MKGPSVAGRCTVIVPGPGTRACQQAPAAAERYQRCRRVTRRACAPALRARGSAGCGFTCLPPGALPLPCRRAVRHFVRLRLDGGVMKRARRSFESFAALAKAGAAPGQPGGYEENRVPRPENGKPAARFPGGPGQGQPARRTSPPGHHRRCHRSSPPRRRSPVSARRERGGQHRARHVHRGGTGTIGGDEQVKFPALPRDRHPSSGHPLPDMPAHHRLPAREGQRCPDRALPPGPPRNTRPALPPVASHTDHPPTAQTARAGAIRPGKDHATDPSGHRPQPTHREGTRDIRPGAARRLAAAINWAVHTRPIWVHQIDSRPCRETSE